MTPSKTNRPISPATESYIKWKDTGDHQYRDETLRHLYPAIKSSIKSYGGGDSSLVPRAYILASEALDSYDPSKGAKLDTHIHNQLKKLSRARSERIETMHLPENVRYDSSRVYKFIDEFRGMEGREPSVTEIRDATGLSPIRIEKARNVGKEKTFTQMETEKGDDPTGIRRTYPDIWKDYVYEDLDPINKKIFEWATGYGGVDVISKKEMAERLGMSSSAVSQRADNIVKQLQKGLIQSTRQDMIL